MGSLEKQVQYGILGTQVKVTSHGMSSAMTWSTESILFVSDNKPNAEDACQVWSHHTIIHFPRSPSHHCPSIRSRVLHHGRLQALWVLHIDGLHVAVQLLLGALLVVSLPRDAHPQSVWNALDPGLPHLLVELRVETDVMGTLLFL